MTLADDGGVDVDGEATANEEPEEPAVQAVSTRETVGSWEPAARDRLVAGVTFAVGLVLLGLLAWDGLSGPLLTMGFAFVSVAALSRLPSVRDRVPRPATLVVLAGLVGASYLVVPERRDAVLALAGLVVIGVLARTIPSTS